ncbi:MAG: hypothetical protein LBP59_03625, partial [Planctomycetaceae bacterium]|nr:hypothetical protein [Planctomycetaceae bacterium]
MKTVICLLASAIALCGTVFAQNKEKTPNQNTPNQNKNKILIAYFSWGGNTRSMAKQIQEQTGGDLFEIVAVKPYPKNYDECVSLAKKEQQNNTRPQFSGEVKNIADYDVIFVGYPNWWGSMPMVLFTFLEK